MYIVLLGHDLIASPACKAYILDNNHPIASRASELHQMRYLGLFKLLVKKGEDAEQTTLKLDFLTV
jgi:hypothetical protein